MGSDVVLAACPFCDGHASVLDTMPAGKYWVRCDNCGAESESAQTKVVAVAAWNRRTHPVASAAPADQEEVLDAIRPWLSSDHIQLHAGEMTAQELRSVKAVVSAVYDDAARALKDKSPPVPQAEAVPERREIVKRLRSGIKQIEDIPPSIQSQANIRLVEAVHNAIDALQQESPRAVVKPLEWEPANSDGIKSYSSVSDRAINEKAITPFGAYFIEHDEGDDSYWLLNKLLGHEIAGPFADISDARAAGDAHHEQRILSALAHPLHQPAPDAGKVLGWARKKDLNFEAGGHTAFWVSATQSVYYDTPVFAGAHAPDAEPDDPEVGVEALAFGYTNWRGEYSERRVMPGYIWFGATEWHSEPQWLLHAHDLEKGAERDFAIQDFGRKVIAIPAPEPQAPVPGIDRITRRIAELDEQIAAYPSWGAALTAMDEERRGLQSRLSVLRRPAQAPVPDGVITEAIVERAARAVFEAMNGCPAPEDMSPPYGAGSKVGMAWSYARAALTASAKQGSAKP